MRPGAPISATWRSNYHLDLFAVGADGKGYNAWWEYQTRWQDWGVVVDFYIFTDRINAVYNFLNESIHLVLPTTQVVGGLPMMHTSVWRAASGWSRWTEPRWSRNVDSNYHLDFTVRSPMATCSSHKGLYAVGSTDSRRIRMAKLDYWNFRDEWKG
ncbi:hypothetical protein VHEMI01314 [[Torrubiella] hemipterigena]|uniref:Uncharacterized protein n=1 Tax=[Torrubiella] hemipterigena TaxID=1531966 RepID=A0A0A1T542_9HYPO|nr:hypothetical protein VHEMI01314 [[Torrubiella] hemipterigena]